MRYPDGREMTVSIKHLAPKGQSMMSQPTPEVSVEEEHLAPDRASMSQPSSQPVEEHPTTLTPSGTAAPPPL